MSLYEPLNEKKTPLTLLLKGDSGSGKTFKAAHFPSPAIFNFDDNIVGLKKLPESVRKEIKIVNPRTDMNGKEIPVTKFWDNFVTKLNALCNDPSVKTIILDSLSTFQDCLSWQLLGAKNPMLKPKGYDHWAYFKGHLLAFADQVLHSPNLDKHIIVIAHDRVEKDEISGTVSRELSLDGSMKEKLPLHFSDVWECYTRVLTDGKVEYKIRTVPGSNFSAKCSLNLPSDFIFDNEKDNLIKQLTL